VLLNAVYDASTIWPAGVDPAIQGAVARTWSEELSRVAHHAERVPEQAYEGWPQEAEEQAQPGWSHQPEPAPEAASQPEWSHEPEPGPEAEPHSEPPAGEVLPLSSEALPLSGEGHETGPAPEPQSPPPLRWPPDDDIGADEPPAG
jgi:hypothetical protein